MKIKALKLLQSVDALRRIGQLKLPLAVSVGFARWLREADRAVQDLAAEQRELNEEYNRRATEAAKRAAQADLDTLNSETAAALQTLLERDVELPEFSLSLRDLRGNSPSAGDLCAVSWLLEDFDTWDKE